MINIEINKKAYKIPTSFAELSLRDYCRCFNGLEKTDGLSEVELFKATKRIEATILSRLMDEADDFAMDLPLTVYASLVEATQFIYGMNNLRHSGNVEVNGKVYKVLKPEEMNLRQWIDIDVTGEEDNADKFIDILSMLLVEQGEDGQTKPYKGYDAEFAKTLGDLSCDKALPVVYRFFLRGAISSRIIQLYSNLVEVNLSPQRTAGS